VQPGAPVQALLDVLCGRNNSWPRLDATGWQAFETEAARHGVSALAYHELARDAHAPPQVVRSLEHHHVRNRLRNLRLYAWLGALLEGLTAAAIDVIVLKGAFLARAVYADPALRAMSDVDLLVRRRDLERTASTMRALGWLQSAPLPAGGHQLPAFELEGVLVDVHWNIEDDDARFAIDPAGLWERAVPARIGHAQAFALSPPDLLLHLCLHTAYGHGWKQFDGGLRQLADIAAVVRHHGPTIDWQGFATRAEAWRVDRCAWLALITARDLLRADVPDSVLDRLARQRPDARWVLAASELALGCHYIELARGLPALANSWLNKRWRRLSRAARWRAHLLPADASLRRAYPVLERQMLLAHLAHWKDLAGDALRLAFTARHRALWARERERRRLIAWLEGSAQQRCAR